VKVRWHTTFAAVEIKNIITKISAVKMLHRKCKANRVYQEVKNEKLYNKIVIKKIHKKLQLFGHYSKIYHSRNQIVVFFTERTK